MLSISVAVDLATHVSLVITGNMSCLYIYF